MQIQSDLHNLAMLVIFGPLLVIYYIMSWFNPEEYPIVKVPGYKAAWGIWASIMLVFVLFLYFFLKSKIKKI